jgi:hypothetical protein
MPTVLAASSVSRDDLISLLAYFSWEARGRTDGSAEDDWLRAERELWSLEGSKKERPASGGVSSNPLALDPSAVKRVSSILDSFRNHIAIDYYSCLT